MFTEAEESLGSRWILHPTLTKAVLTPGCGENHDLPRLIKHLEWQAHGSKLEVSRTLNRIGMRVR